MVRACKQMQLSGVLALSLLAGCQRAPDAPAATEPAAAPTDAAATAAAATGVDGPLQDVMERTPAYVVGVSFPPGLERYPGLVKVVRDYVGAARAELTQAVDGLGNDKPSAPYELSLNVEKPLDTSALVVVSAEGSQYTGGAHGQPLVARFVWLPQQQRLLTSEALVPNAQGWVEIGRYVSAQLHAAAEARAVADKLEPQEHASLVASADKMIAEGTAPKAENFSQFQPLLDASGKIGAVRFVFPPYQVGPYSDGTQTVDVPVSVLLPWVAPDYAELFAR